jgi:site-specific DNA-methyltransferase (adenine-specific)
VALLGLFSIDVSAQSRARAGFYETEYGKYEKIQILTVEDLFDGKRPHMPWVDSSVFKKAKREKTEKQSELDI